MFCFLVSVNGYQITFFQTVYKDISLTETKEVLEHVSFYRKQPSQTKVRCPICSEYRSAQRLTLYIYSKHLFYFSLFPRQSEDKDTNDTSESEASTDKGVDLELD